MRPLGIYPPWGGAIASIPGYGFLPGKGPPPHTGALPRNDAYWNKWTQQVGQWLYHDALEVLNWGPSNPVGALSVSASAQNAFSYDPTRGLYFLGGQGTSPPNGILAYSWDGWNWKTVGSGVLPPTNTGGDSSDFFCQGVSDTGQYFTWRNATASLIISSKVYLNDNAGLAGWTASTNQAAHTGIIFDAHWAASDNRFLVMGLKGGVNCAFAVDVGSDTWTDLVLPGAAVESPAFGVSSPGDRVVATQTRLWRTASIAQNFAAVSVPWQAPGVTPANLLNLVWLAGSFVFLAVTANAIYASANSVRWDQVTTGLEGKGTFSGPAAGLGDAAIVAFRRTNPDGIASDCFLLGKNALRSWTAYQAPQSLASGAQPILDLQVAGDRLVSLNKQSPTKLRFSVGIRP